MVDVTTSQSQERPQVRPADAESELQKMFDNYSEAIKSGNLERILSFYSKDVVAFDLMPPLKISGVEEYRKSWEQYVKSCEFPTQSEIHDAKYTVNGDLGAAYCLIHFLGKSKEGQNLDMWFRNTVIARKIGGEWKITHENNSVPIDMESEKALWNLKPDQAPTH